MLESQSTLQTMSTKRQDVFREKKSNETNVLEEKTWKKKREKKKIGKENWQAKNDFGNGKVTRRDQIFFSTALASSCEKKIFYFLLLRLFTVYSTCYRHYERNTKSKHPKIVQTHLSFS